MSTPALVLSPGAHEEQRLVLPVAGGIIGREARPGIHLVVPSSGVSGTHARIYPSADGEWFLEDLGSTNGTEIDGVLIEPNSPTPLRHGTTLVLGDALARFELSTTSRQRRSVVPERGGGPGARNVGREELPEPVARPGPTPDLSPVADALGARGRPTAAPPSTVRTGGALPPLADPEPSALHPAGYTEPHARAAPPVSRGAPAAARLSPGPSTPAVAPVSAPEPTARPVPLEEGTIQRLRGVARQLRRAVENVDAPVGEVQASVGDLERGLGEADREVLHARLARLLGDGGALRESVHDLKEALSVFRAAVSLLEQEVDRAERGARGGGVG